MASIASIFVIILTEIGLYINFSSVQAIAIIKSSRNALRRILGKKVFIESKFQRSSSSQSDQLNWLFHFHYETEYQV